MNDEQARTLLTEALLAALTNYSEGKTAPEVDLFDYQADALLPTVRRLIADELRAAADWLWDDNGPAAEAYHHLRARADTIDPQ